MYLLPLALILAWRATFFRAAERTRSNAELCLSWTTARISNWLLLEPLGFLSSTRDSADGPNGFAASLERDEDPWTASWSFSGKRESDRARAWRSKRSQKWEGGNKWACRQRKGGVNWSKERRDWPKLAPVLLLTLWYC